MHKTLPIDYQMESARLTFTIPVQADNPHVFEALHSEGFMDGMTWDAPETEQALAPSIGKMREAWQGGKSYTFSAYKKPTADFVGRFGIYLSDVAHVWKIFYYVHPQHQQAGLATEGATKLLELGFTKLGAQSIEAFHVVSNKASQRILEKIGMTLIEHIPQSFQKHGKWVADNRFGIDRGAWRMQAAQRSIAIRVATTSDLPQILDIRHRAFSKMAPQSYSAVEVETLLQDYTEDEFLQMIAEQRLFVAVRAGAILGSAGWDSTNIRHVYVDPNALRKGVGARLMAHAEADYRAQTKNPSIQLGSTLYARGFYEKCGYQVVKRAKAWDGSDYFQMNKVFNAQSAGVSS